MSTERRRSPSRTAGFLRAVAAPVCVGGALLVPVAGALAYAPVAEATPAPSQSPAPDSGASQRPTEQPTEHPTRQLGPEREPHGKPGSPQGSVAAGAQGVRDAGDPVFLAAGGGMAAAGAAGLGYAMLRRGRTDS